jgi:hypothetical protein
MFGQLQFPMNSPKSDSIISFDRSVCNLITRLEGCWRTVPSDNHDGIFEALAHRAESLGVASQYKMSAAGRQSQAYHHSSLLLLSPALTRTPSLTSPFIRVSDRLPDTIEMAPQHVSTAIKEEWSLTDEQVDLIEASTAHSAQAFAAHKTKLGLVNSAAPAVAPDEDVAKILVPTPDWLEQARGIVATWGVEEPSKGDLTGSTKFHLNAKTVLEMVNNLVKDLKQKKGFLATALKVQDKAKEFVMQCLHNAHDDNYAIWDATSITKQILSIGQDGASSYEHEELSSEEDNYGQLHLALGYCAHLKAFTCGYSFVYRSQDELTTAITDSGTTVRINAIRILYAELLAQHIHTKGDKRFKLVASNEPYPALIE